MPQNFDALAKKLEPAKKPKLLIVGFYHFSNPKPDLVKADLDDHLSEFRQLEIAELNNRLAKFKPTKIAVEAPVGDTKINDRFQLWANGKSSLTVNETQQVGFRLAKLMGHSKLYPIDYKQDMDFAPTMKLAQEALPQKAKEFMETTKLLQEIMVGLKDHSVLENVRFSNQSEADRIGNGIYLRLLAITQGDQHPGADLIAGWWKRNMVWISNLSTVATDPNDRVLVICGGGHASLLRSLLRDSIDFEVVDQTQYLKK